MILAWDSNSKHDLVVHWQCSPNIILKLISLNICSFSRRWVLWVVFSPKPWVYQTRVAALTSYVRTNRAPQCEPLAACGILHNEFPLLNDHASCKLVFPEEQN